MVEAPPSEANEPALQTEEEDIDTPERTELADEPRLRCCCCGWGWAVTPEVLCGRST